MRPPMMRRILLLASSVVLIAAAAHSCELDYVLFTRSQRVAQRQIDLRVRRAARRHAVSTGMIPRLNRGDGIFKDYRTLLRREDRLDDPPHSAEFYAALNERFRRHPSPAVIKTHRRRISPQGTCSVLEHKHNPVRHLGVCSYAKGASAVFLARYI